MNIDTTPEIEAEAARVLAMILHAGSPVPVPVAADMLMDAGADDRSDVVFLLFQAAGNMLLADLGGHEGRPEAGAMHNATDRRQEAWRAYCNAWDFAHRIACGLSGQLSAKKSNHVVAAFRDELRSVPGVGNAGISLIVKKMVLQNWNDRLTAILPVLCQLEDYEAEDLSPRPA